MTKQRLFLSSAISVLTLYGAGAHAAAAAAAASSTASSNSADTTVSELIVTAEKREQNLQTVPVAISAYTAEKRQLLGIDSIQDMTNFTPGLEYNSSTDRISLRGVGRLTNVLSADASVANYSDGIYETFAVGAGASTLFLDRVEILRGPQGTLYGRNAIGGAINIISRRPTSTPYAEIRGTYSNYNRFILEGAISGPITNNIQARLSGAFEKQSKGWIHNVVPGVADEGNIITTGYVEGQLKWKINDNLDFWAKVGYNQWSNGSGGPGAASGGWTPFPFMTTEFANAATQLNPGYGCTSNVTNVVNASPLGCVNPAQKSPFQEARAVPYRVRLPYAFQISSQITYHLPGADIKYLTGGVNYHYILTGPSGGTNGAGYAAPITSYTLPGLGGSPGLVINPQETFVYQELNAFWSHEINIVSTGNGPLQWLAGAYYYRQHYRQPVYTENLNQPQFNNVFAGTCPAFATGCPQQTDFRRFDNRPSVTNKSEAVFGQLDYKADEHLKFTAGLRYSHDEKSGSESVRILCFAIPACYLPPEVNFFAPIPSVDLSQIGTVVSTGRDISGNPAPPQGVRGPTTYDPKTGFASRLYDAKWQAVTGTAGFDWTPDSDTLVYFKYSRGYKSGGFNIGIFTVLSFQPYTAAEHVDSFELGYKKTIGHNLTFDAAAFYYIYRNLQIPITTVGSAGGITQASTTFYNVPTAISRGIEFELNWVPIRNLNILANYSFLDAYATSGQVSDIADPDALQPNASPVPCNAAVDAPGSNCTTDIYTKGVQKLQYLAGSRLPNSPKHKIALNATYTWHFEPGSLSASVSYVWRDKQYGTLFSRYYNASPSWDQVDGRVTWNSSDGKIKLIGYVKNLLNTIGYDAGAYGTRYAGNNDQIVKGKFPYYGPVQTIESTGIGSTYSVTPPRTYGVELDYKFF